VTVKTVEQAEFKLKLMRIALDDNPAEWLEEALRCEDIANRACLPGHLIAAAMMDANTAMEVAGLLEIVQTPPARQDRSEGPAFDWRWSDDDGH
jgi:hypothetical protein